MWGTTIHSHGVEVAPSLRASIEELLRAALVGFERRVHVHVRLYGDLDDNGLYTCYVRAKVPPPAGVALGEAAPDLRVAVERAVARIGRSVRSLDMQRCAPFEVPVPCDARSAPRSGVCETGIPGANR